MEGAVQVKFDEQRGIVLRIFSGDLAGSEFVINPAALRRDSRDAASINEMTGEQVLAALLPLEFLLFSFDQCPSVDAYLFVGLLCAGCLADS